MKKLLRRVTDKHLRLNTHGKKAALKKLETRIVVEQTAENTYAAQIPGKLSEDLLSRSELRKFLAARGLDQERLDQLLHGVDETGKDEIVVDPSAALLP